MSAKNYLFDIVHCYFAADLADLVDLNTLVSVGSLNKDQVQRKIGKLIIAKMTEHTARWLYRLLKKYCVNDEQ